MNLAHGNWELRLGDCLDPVTGLASLGDKSVDHVICDPPYSSMTHANARTNQRDGSGKNPAGGFVHLIAFDSLNDETRNVLALQFARIANRWMLIFSDDDGSYGWRLAVEAADLEYLRTGRWIRIGTMPQLTGDRPAQGDEAIIIAHPPGKKAWNGGGRPAIWSFPIVTQAGERLHPTQKPLALMESLIRDFTDLGDLICDPFAGSGTTGVAAIRLGRRFIGWERDPKYHAIAAKRIAKAREQLELFGAA